MTNNYWGTSLNTVPGYIAPQINMGLPTNSAIMSGLMVVNPSSNNSANNITSLVNNLLNTINTPVINTSLTTSFNNPLPEVNLPLATEFMDFTTGSERLDRLGNLRGTSLGRALSMPLAAYSWLVGHDGALRAAQNGDIAGWYVNRFDHSTHSHLLGGNKDTRSASPLAFIGTIGQEIGNLVGLDKPFGSALDYDLVFGTNYAIGHSHGEPTHIGDLIRRRFN